MSQSNNERVFFNEGGIYISDSRVVINGTTYSTANITSVRQAVTVTPPSSGCAVLLICLSAIAAPCLLIALLVNHSAAIAVGFGISAAIFVLALRYRMSLKEARNYHVMLASAGGERTGFTSTDSVVVDRVTASIGDAIAHRR